MRFSFAGTLKTSSESSISETFFKSRFITSNLAIAVPLGERKRLRFDLDIDARGEIQLHQRVQRLLRRLEDVQQSLMGADFELLSALLVHVRAAQDRELVYPRRQGNRTCDLRARSPGGLDDLSRALIEELRVICLQPDSNLLRRHRSRLSCYRRARVLSADSHCHRSKNRKGAACTTPVRPMQPSFV